MSTGRVRRKLASVVAAGGLAIGLASCGGGSGAKPPAPGATPSSTPPAQIRVTSTLDGMTRIPLRTRWIATASPAAEVDHVDFLIDGKLAWSEGQAPYVFGGDDNGIKDGFLITTWLHSGNHRFTARAVSTNGPAFADTVAATVAAAPQPPAALRGVWKRMITQSALDNAGASSGTPPGRWRLAFDQVGSWELDPQGSGVVTQFTVTGNVMNVYAPISEMPSNNGQGGDRCLR